MAQFDVYRLGADALVVDIQSDLVDTLANRIVVPLLPVDDAPQPIGRVNFALSINGADYMVETQYIASVPTVALTRPVASVPQYRDEITRALDMLFHGI